jgi:hypothetical protein
VTSFSPLMPDALIDCVATGREPSAVELVELADRVWSEAADRRSAFDWDGRPTRTMDRVIALRAARLAFRGSCAEPTQTTAADHFGRRNGLSTRGSATPVCARPEDLA